MTEQTTGPQASGVLVYMVCRARKPSTLEACGPVVCSVISLHLSFFTATRRPELQDIGHITRSLRCASDSTNLGTFGA